MEISGKVAMNKKWDEFEERIDVPYKDSDTCCVGYLANVKQTNYIDKNQIEKSALL